MPFASLKSSSGRDLALAGCAGLGLSLMSALPVSAHGLAGAGLAGGFSHPLTGLDHLFLLVGVGAASSFVSAQLLLFALAGAVVGALFGVSGGGLPVAELLAALAVSGLGVLILMSRRSGQPPSIPAAGTVVAVAVAIHAMLHGHEASGASSWWAGALLASGLTVGVTFLLLRRLGTAWTVRLAVLLTVVGALLALGPIGLLAGAGAGAA
jgi:urease accessory protein